MSSSLKKIYIYDMICCPVVVTGICLFSYVEYQVDFVLVQQQQPQNKCYVCILSPANLNCPQLTAVLMWKRKTNLVRTSN